MGQGRRLCGPGLGGGLEGEEPGELGEVVGAEGEVDDVYGADAEGFDDDVGFEEDGGEVACVGQEDGFLSPLNLE